jgi:ATP-dependent Clp protease ATP-binding subunit ClpC
MPLLRFLNGPQSERIVDIEGGEVLGRAASSSIQILGPGISRQHCRIVHASPYFILLDLESHHGTMVNGERVEKALLRDQDVLTIGYLELRYEDARLEVRPTSLDALRTPPLPHAPADPPAPADANADSQVVLVSNAAQACPRTPEGSPTPPTDPPSWIEDARDLPDPEDPRNARTRPPSSAESALRAQPAAQGSQRILDRLGIDLTAQARAGELDPLIGRKQELRRLGQVLLQKRKPNAVLVGEPGVGKTCLVEGLAQRMAAPDAPPRLAKARLVQIALGDLVAGTKYRGEFEERVQQLLREAEAEGEVILFLDELHLTLGLGRSENSPTDAANLLKPALARAAIRVIGATTPEEYERHVARDRAFARRFEVVWIEEPTRGEAREILLRLRPSYEEHHGLKILDEALDAAVELSLRYVPDRRLPDKALDLLDQACARALLGTFRVTEEGSTLEPVGRTQVADVIAARCRVPRSSLLVSESERLEGLAPALLAEVVGQASVVSAVSDVLRSARAGLRAEQRPRASFLFVGPSGVGKTALAKALTRYLFQDEDRLLRIDLSEYAEPHSVARLLGAPPGYVGHDEEGQLSGPIRRAPFSVVLFDELEKAHPEVLNVLLQLLDEGRVTDARGRPASFREAIVILSSNLGHGAGEAERGALGFGEEQVASPARLALEATLRPELLNRIDRVLEFQPLSVDALELVVDLEIAKLSRRLEAQGVRLALSEEARRALAERGHDTRYGARELLRVLEAEIGQPLARALVEGALRPADCAHLELTEGKFSLRFEEAAAD